MFKLDYLSLNWLILKVHNKKVEKHLNKITGIVYDFGCGTKPYEEDILKVSDKYIGIDWSNTPHELKADIVADLNEKISIDDSVANTIVSFQVMEHLREPQNMLNEAYRILKQDGTIFLTVPFQWWVHEAPYDYYRYTQYGLKYIFEKAGFSDIHIEPHGGFFTMWILKLNYFSYRFIRGPKLLKMVLTSLCVPFWFLGQVVAPYLDKLDVAKERETTGYTVLARKK